MPPGKSLKLESWNLCTFSGWRYSLQFPSSRSRPMFSVSPSNMGHLTSMGGSVTYIFSSVSCQCHEWSRRQVGLEPTNTSWLRHKQSPRYLPSQALTTVPRTSNAMWPTGCHWPQSCGFSRAWLLIGPSSDLFCAVFCTAVVSTLIGYTPSLTHSHMTGA